MAGRERIKAGGGKWRSRENSLWRHQGEIGISRPVERLFYFIMVASAK